MESALSEADDNYVSTLIECNVFRGNNKTYKNSMRWQLSTSRDCTITDMHILSGSLWICSQPSQSPSYSFVRSTVNPTRNLNNSFPIFYFTENSADTISSHDCINFGDCGRETLSWVKPPEPVVFSIAQNAKNLINWGSVSLEAIPRLTALPCYA